MADIDKSLPNELRTEVEIPAEEEVVEEEVVEQGPVEVIPEEDGGVTLDFEPGAINVPGTENHFDNLEKISSSTNLLVKTLLLPKLSLVVMLLTVLL